MFRIVGSLFPETLPNFQPLAALFFCGPLLAPGLRGLLFPVALWLITYPFGIGPITDVPIFLTALGGLLATFWIGRKFVAKSGYAIICGSVAAAIVFHLLTNTIAWIGDPTYQKTLTGFWQSQWTGPVVSQIPSWVFLRNFAAANVLFSTLFVLARFKLHLPALQPESKKEFSPVR